MKVSSLEFRLPHPQTIDALVHTPRGLHIVGRNLAELSPPYDLGEITSLLAANLLYELLCVL